MKVEVDIDELSKGKIDALEKKVKSLERTLSTRDRQIVELKSRWNVSQPQVREIRDVASRLCDLLEDNELVEYARYGNTC